MLGLVWFGLVVWARVDLLLLLLLWHEKVDSQHDSDTHCSVVNCVCLSLFFLNSPSCHFHTNNRERELGLDRREVRTV